MGLPVMIRETGHIKELTTLSIVDDDKWIEDFVGDMIEFDYEINCRIAYAEEFEWWMDAIYKNITMYDKIKSA